ncbi:MAG: FAD binding domain-containing protein [Desulfurococcaceae archaeon]
MFIHSFDIYRPRSLAEALEFLAKNSPDVKPLAGGTELLLLIRDRKIPTPRFLLDLSPLRRELSYVKVENRRVRVGALTRVYDLSTSILHRDVRFAGFVDVWRKFATLAIRFSATIGGNIATATQYSDYIPLLLVYDARVKLASVDGERELSLEEFLLDNRATALKPHELITEITFDYPPDKTSSAFVKFDRRSLLIAGVVTCAVYATLVDGVMRDVRVAYDMVIDKRIPARIREIEDFLKGKVYTEELVEKAAEDVLPRVMKRITDWWTTAEYRLEMSKVALKDGLSVVKERVEKGCSA